MVVVAAVLLAGASVVFKDAQQENARIDKMEQILRSIGQSTDNNAEVPSLYAKYITKAVVIDAQGQELKAYEGDQLAGKDDAVFNEALEEGQYPVYEAQIDATKAYIFPLKGAGLWGPIWGYISVDAADGSTVIGVDLGNASETPGLGAEMSATFFMARFKGKQLFRDGAFKGIAIVKPNTQLADQDYVDGLTGGTITSNGVHEMLAKSLAPYQSYLETKKAN